MLIIKYGGFLLILLFFIYICINMNNRTFRLFFLLFSLIVFSSLSLKGQEKKFIVRGDDNFPPFEFINEDGKIDGFNVDIIREIMMKSGLKFDLDLVLWENAVAGFNDGSIDILTGTTNNHNWGDSVLFGIPYYTVTLSIASRSEDNYTSISELVGKDIIVRGDTWSETFLENNGIAANIVVIDNLDSALVLLSEGMYDALMNSTMGTLYSLKKNHIPGVTVNTTYVREEDFSFCLKSENAEILYAMNKALDQMKIDGSYDRIYDKWFKEYDVNPFLKYLWLIIIIAVVIAIGLLYVISLLRRKEKVISDDLSNSKQRLREKNRQLEMVLTAGSIIPMFWDIKTDRIYLTSKNVKEQYMHFNQTAGYVSMAYALDQVHPDDREKVAAAFNAIVNDTQDDIRSEARYDINRVFDKYFSFHIVVDSRDTDGHPATAIGYMQDITERRKAEAVLRQNESFLSYILNSIPFPIEVKDVENEFQFTFWNNQSTIEYGDLYHKSLNAILPPEEVERIHKIDREVYETGNMYFNQETLSTLDGKVHDTVVQKSRVSINGRNMVLIVRWDISNVKELEKGLDQVMKQLEEAKNTAVQADQLKSAFLANMSHEIRTPLNAIVGFSQLMGTAETPEEKAEYSNIITTSSENLLRLINDILDLSKIEAGYIEIKKIDFDLTKLFKMLYTTFTQRMKPGIELILDNPYETCFITADKNRLTQVVTNFMTNSIKFTTEGSITMGYKALDDNNIRFWVSDTGCGIPDDKKQRVFGRFEKLNDFAQGNGLGLSICKTIIETSGGKIGFESELGKGSTFWAELPTPVIIGKL